MKTRTLFLVGLCAITMPFLSFAQRDGRGGGGHPVNVGGGHASGFAPRGPTVAPHAGTVERSNHGSLRHEETHIVRAPEVRHEEHRGVVVAGGRPNYYVHHDADIDVHTHHYWNDFARGRRFDRLPGGYLRFNIGGLPYFYYGGIYYQSAPGGYEEVYPPLGAVLPQPPEGSFEVIAPNGQVFYYAGGAFYQQQPDGTFALVPPPLGVIVPEPPPGAVQVAFNGGVAYQFNGIYYRPVFVNGVTQYQTISP